VATLTHELARVTRGMPPAEPAPRGGLAGWQKNRASQYIEANLAEPILLTALAEVVRLSPFHFARAFKQSFSIRRTVITPIGGSSARRSYWRARHAL